jgi:hypothetical protein
MELFISYYNNNNNNKIRLDKIRRPLALTNPTLWNSNFLESAVKKFHAPTAEPEIPLPYSQNPATRRCHAPTNSVYILTQYCISNSHFNAPSEVLHQAISASLSIRHFTPLRYSATLTYRPCKSVNRSSL